MTSLRLVLPIALCTALHTASAGGPALPTLPSLPSTDNTTVEEVNIPSKFHRKAKGYEKALELQKATGADLFVYFESMSPADQKGLCKWFENKGLKSGPVSRHLRDYIKVRITLPAGRKEEAIVDTFRVNSCPAVFIVHANGWKKRCPVFDWENRRPKLKEQKELVEMFRKASGPRYQEEE